MSTYMHDSIAECSLLFYVPALIAGHTPRRAFYRHLFIARQQTPDQVCGKARYVGYSNRAKKRERPMYRLMIYTAGTTNTRRMQLPDLFILEQGVFRTYTEDRDYGVL